MIYVLFVILVGGNSTYAITTQEFNTFKQCQYAAELVRDRVNTRAVYCIEKGETK